MSATNKTIQQKIADLDELVAWFDSDDFAIENAVEKFKQAEVLASDIEKSLNDFQNDIRIIKERFDQTIDQKAS